MSGESAGIVVPVWALAAEAPRSDLDVAHWLDGGPVSADRLAQLRDGLVSILDTSLVTLEAYPLPGGGQSQSGFLVDAANPLAQFFAGLAKSSSVPSPSASGSAETLYRMVIPSKVAAEMGSGLVRSMPSSAVAGGIHSGILGKAGLVGNATFVPATIGGSAGVAASSAAAGGGTAAAVGGTAGAIAVAGLMIVLAIATAASIYAEDQRRQAMDRVTDLLGRVVRAELESERDRLMGATRAIEKATAVLLDDGKIGHSLGLDTAINTIDTALATAARRASMWRDSVDKFLLDGAEVKNLKKAFPGIDEIDGEFRVRLRLAGLTIALKRRVAVLQAVEHAQDAPKVKFVRFTNALRQEQRAIDDLEILLSGILGDLSALRILPPSRKVDQVLTRGEVNKLLAWPGRLRELAMEESPALRGASGELELGFIQQANGDLRALPLQAVA